MMKKYKQKKDNLIYKKIIYINKNFFTIQLKDSKY